MQTLDRQTRLERVREQLAEQKIDCLLVSDLINIRYLTGFTGSNGLLLVTPNSSTLYTDPRYTLQAQAETGGKVVIGKGPLLPRVLKAIAKAKLKTVGFENLRAPYSLFAALDKDLPEAMELKPIGRLLEDLRLVKSEAEIDLIRRSVLTNSKALDRALKGVKAGMSERTFAAEIEYQMRRAGAEGSAFETIVACGPRAALPHARPTANPLRLNQLLLVDMGALQDGYTSDMTRMFHLGQPSRKTRQMYKAVLESQLAGIDAVRPGVTAQKVDRAVRDVLQKHGLDKAFTHSTGHGLGLEIHEAPRLGRKDKTKLEAGMAVTIEPGIYLEGFGGIRIEDTVIVTKHGAEILTPTSKELVVV